MSFATPLRYSQLSTVSLARAELVGSDLFLELNPDLPVTTTTAVPDGDVPIPSSADSPDVTAIDGVDMSED